MTSGRRKPRTSRRRKVQNGALLVVTACFLSSATIRLGLSGPAIAEEINAARVGQSEDQTAIAAENVSFEELDAMLEAIRERQATLDAEEARVDERLAVLESAQAEFERKRQELLDAEQRLAATLSQTDGAVLRDIAQLTAMYESMKPKNAAQIFNEMDPNFSAGFLIRMNPQAAADILAAMETDVAYEVSVLMANRNIATIAN